MSCFDHRAIWAYDYARAEQVLDQFGQRLRAQQELQYWSRTDDKVYQWIPADGDFDAWLDGMPDPADARKCWETHAQSSANMVIFNGGQWGPKYANFNPRGQYVTWPGGHGTEWHPDGDKVTEVWQVPRGMFGVIQLGPAGLDGQGRYACWYIPE